MLVDRREAVLARLEREKDEILEYLRANQVALGDGAAVVYDEDFAEKNQISQFGKMTFVSSAGKSASFQGGEFQYHATPRKFLEETKYEMPEKNFISFADAYADGKECRMPDDAFKLPDQPKLKKKGVPYRWHDKAERRLLEHLAKQGRTVCAVNPSYSTLWHMLEYGGGLVYVREEREKQWKLELVNFCVDHPLLRFVHYLPTAVVCYMGANNPTFFPDREYVYLCPNPYSVSLPFEVYSIKEHAGGVSFSYFTKVERNSFLSDSSGEYIYNPAVLTDVTKGDPYFVCSNFDLKIEECEMKTMVHTPFFLGDMPDYTEENGRTVSRRGNLIYDIQGAGTYLSRRSRLQLKEGESWAPFLGNGEWMVTRLSNSPQRTSVFVDRSIDGASVTMLSRTPDGVEFLPYQVVEGDFKESEAGILTLSGKHVSQQGNGKPVSKFVWTKRGYEILEGIKTVGFVFQPDSKDGSVFEVPIQSLEECLLVYVDKKIFAGNVFFFLDKSQLEECRMWYAMYSTKWSNFFTNRVIAEVPRVKKPPDAAIPEVLRLIRVERQMQWSDLAPSFQQLYDSVGQLRLTKAMLLSVLCQKNGVVSWFGGYTVLSSIAVVVPGEVEVVAGVNKSNIPKSTYTLAASGNSVRMILETLTSRSHSILKVEFVPDSMMLLRFLEDNGLLICRHKRKIEGRYALYHVHAAAWAPLARV
jgi:hypothetical protein